MSHARATRPRAQQQTGDGQRQQPGRVRRTTAAAAAAAAATTTTPPATYFDASRSPPLSGADDDRKSTTFSNPASTGPADYEKNLWVPPAPAASPPPSQPGPVTELPGSTYIYEHHPAYGVGSGSGGGVGAGAGEAYQHTSYNGNPPSEAAPETPSGVISPMEGPHRE